MHNLHFAQMHICIFFLYFKWTLLNVLDKETPWHMQYKTSGLFHFSDLQTNVPVKNTTKKEGLLLLLLERKL